jgi:4'-phosphopantetheinyl transferase
MHIEILPYSTILQAYTDDVIESVISSEDQQRASRFLRKEDRSRYIAARLLLYRNLDLVYGSFAIPLKFSYSRFGKPELNESGIQFNWSHSGLFVALIIANDTCGIDVEEHRDIIPESFESVFTELERKWMYQDRNYSLLTDRFFQLWTAKESVLKRIGTGLSTPLRDIEINMLNNESLQWKCDSFEGISKHFSYKGKRYSVSVTPAGNDESMSILLPK